MITRRDPYTNTGEQFWAEQAIELSQALQIYTRNGAVAMKKEAIRGQSKWVSMPILSSWIGIYLIFQLPR